MVDAEPDELAIVGALAGHLKVQVLLQVPLVGRVGGVELVLLVICLDNVLEDSSRLPEGEVVVVGVDDGGKAAVGIDFKEPVHLRVLDDDLSKQYAD